MGNCPTVTKVMQYKSILPFGDLNVLMDNIDTTLAVSMINAPKVNWIERPIASGGGGGNGGDGAGSNPPDADLTGPPTENGPPTSRKK